MYRTGLRTVSKPEDPQDAPERRARVQPDVPGDYADRTNLSFDVADVSLLRFKAPTIQQVNVARFVALPQSVLPVSFRVMGMRSVCPGTHTVTATLLDERGQSLAETTGDLANCGSLALDTAGLQPGTHALKVRITTADGQLCN